MRDGYRTISDVDTYAESNVESNGVEEDGNLSPENVGQSRCLESHAEKIKRKKNSVTKITPFKNDTKKRKSSWGS